MGRAFPIAPILDVVDDPEFWAVAKIRDSVFHIQVSTGTADSTAALWASAYADKEFAGDFGQAICTDAEAMTHISLVWLMLHEMHHFQMRHFDNPTVRHSLKTDTTMERWLVTRAKNSTVTRSSDATGISLVFEMQADHDATEMLLDAYSLEEWLSLRARIAAISAMMILIDQADSSSGTLSSTHPKAATRIFQLLGHVIDMPMLSLHLKPNLSTDSPAHPDSPTAKEEQDRFAVQVIVPTFFDAMKLARVATARSIADDLGSAADFFSDVQLIKLEEDVETNQLTTAGARQWAELIKLKAKILT